MKPERRGTRAWRALALSVALHAALLLALLRWTAPPPAPAREPIEVTLVPRRPPAPSPVTQERPGRGALGPPGARTPPGTPPAVAAVPEPPGPAGAGDVVRWLGEVPRARPGEDLLALPSWTRRPRLAPAPTPGQALDTRVGEVLDELRARDLSRYPDASWMELRDALGAGFVPPAAALDRANAGGGAGGDLLGRLVDGYAAEVERYGKNLAPRPSAPPDPPGIEGTTSHADERTVASAAAIMHPERAALASAITAIEARSDGDAGEPDPLAGGGLVAVVGVTLDAHGAVSRVRLVTRSASAAYDRAALEQVERLAGRGLSPRLAGTETEWAFVTEVRLRPPSASAAVQLDASFRPTGVALPYQRVVTTRVELRAVRRASRG